MLILKSNPKRNRYKILPILSIVLVGLVLFNLINGLIIQNHEIQSSNPTQQSELIVDANSDFKRPDIYYLVFDEMADTEIVTQYLM